MPVGATGRHALVRALDRERAALNEYPSLLEQFKILRKRSRRGRRPLVRRTASERAKQKLAARKRRRTARSKKIAKLRSMGLKRARKRGLELRRTKITTLPRETRSEALEQVAFILGATFSRGDT